jgi:hypothetical protein
MDLDTSSIDKVLRSKGKANGGVYQVSARLKLVYHGTLKTRDFPRLRQSQSTIPMGQSPGRGCFCWSNFRP